MTLRKSRRLSGAGSGQTDTDAWRRRLCIIFGKVIPLCLDFFFSFLVQVYLSPGALWRGDSGQAHCNFPPHSLIFISWTAFSLCCTNRVACPTHTHTHTQTHTYTRTHTRTDVTQTHAGKAVISLLVQMTPAYLRVVTSPSYQHAPTPRGWVNEGVYLYISCLCAPYIVCVCVCGWGGGYVCETGQCMVLVLARTSQHLVFLFLFFFWSSFDHCQ